MAWVGVKKGGGYSMGSSGQESYGMGGPDRGRGVIPLEILAS